MSEDYERFKDKLSEAEFEQRISDKIKEFQGLLTRDGAITIIASEMGLSVSRPPSVSIKIADITEGVSGIDITAKISRMAPVKQFTKKTTGMPGRLQRFDLADETGTVTLVLWDESIDEVSGVKVGDVIDVSGAYAKKGYSGGVELSLTRKGSVSISDETVDVEVGKTRRVEIGSLNDGMRDISIVGIVVNVSDIREFTKPDRSFKVMSLFIKDSTGQTRVTLWNAMAESAADISVGDIIEVRNCYTRMGYIDIEVQTNSYTELVRNPDTSGMSIPTIDLDVPIGDITSDKQFFTINGIVKAVYEPRTFMRDDGTQGTVATIEVEDETGSCRVTLWEDKAGVASALAPGTSVTIEGCRAREGLNGVEVSVSGSGRVVPHLPDIAGMATSPDGLARVLEVKDGAIKAFTLDGELLLLTEFQSCGPGDLVSYSGTVEGDAVSVEVISVSGEQYPALDALLEPERVSLADAGAGSRVEVQGLVRSASQVRDNTIIRLDDGTATMTGYVSTPVTAGSEYVMVAHVFASGPALEFVSRSVKEVDYVEESYRLLETFDGVE